MGKGHTDQAAYNMLSNYSLGSKGVQLSPPQRKFSIVGQKSMFDRLPNVVSFSKIVIITFERNEPKNNLNTFLLKRRTLNRKKRKHHPETM